MHPAWQELPLSGFQNLDFLQPVPGRPMQVNAKPRDRFRNAMRLDTRRGNWHHGTSRGGCE